MPEWIFYIGIGIQIACVTTMFGILLTGIVYAWREVRKVN